MTDALLSVEDLVKEFPGQQSFVDWIARRPAPPGAGRRRHQLRAAAPARCIALVGESGCGKTTTGNLLMGLIAAELRAASSSTARRSAGSPGAGLRRLRRQVQMVFQDPYESLNPRMRVGDIVAEPLRVHRSRPGDELRAAGGRGADAGRADAGRRVPPSLSRSSCPAASASASSSPPAWRSSRRLLIADEPVSMLDVSIRADILNLLGGAGPRAAGSRS